MITNGRIPTIDEMTTDEYGLRSMSDIDAVVCLFGDDSAPLAVMHIALIRDCLRGADHERLRIACSRPNWTVASD
jgi:hypothetical protein